MPCEDCDNITKITMRIQGDSGPASLNEVCCPYHVAKYFEES